MAHTSADPALPQAPLGLPHAPLITHLTASPRGVLGVGAEEGSGDCPEALAVVSSGKSWAAWEERPELGDSGARSTPDAVGWDC